MLPKIGAVIGLATFSAATPVFAQVDSTPSPLPKMSAAANSRTTLDEEYDGNTHIGVSPFVWLPSLSSTLQFRVPTLPSYVPPIGVLPRSGIARINVRAGPNDYFSSLNSAFMGAVDVRRGAVDGFADFAYANASTGITRVTSIGGPYGIVVPVTIGANGRLISTLWEAGIGLTVARGHAADLQLFEGVREMNAAGTLNYNLGLGPNQIIAKSGSVTSGERLDDFLIGLRGKWFFNSSKLFIPYDFDFGTGSNNDAVQYCGGVGTGLGNGSIFLGWRSLQFFNTPANATIQQLHMGGLLIQYQATL